MQMSKPKNVLHVRNIEVPGVVESAYLSRCLETQVEPGLSKKNDVLHAHEGYIFTIHIHKVSETT